VFGVDSKENEAKRLLELVVFARSLLNQFEALIAAGKLRLIPGSEGQYHAIA
jgi:hypothetical protein